MNYAEGIEQSENAFRYGNILIKGTKSSVGTIIRELSNGVLVEDILNSRPEISKKDILNCLIYAAELVDAIDFKKATKAIDANIERRKALAHKIRGLKKGN